MKANRFGAFADEDAVAADVRQVQQVQKQQEQKKKITVKPIAKQAQEVEGAEEFERVGNRNQPQRGADRGGRGRGAQGQRGDRGGRGRGARPETAGGERPRGGRGGRGRGDRPKTAQPVAAAEGVEKTEENKERRGGRGGRGPRHQGKAREEEHPFDRKDGTGKAHRGDKKGGHGKGNWGKDKPEGEAEAVEERKEERKPKREEPKEEEVVEEVGFTLDDYFAAKQAKSQGLLQQKQAREVEKLDAKNIKDEKYDHSEQERTKIYKKADTQASRAGDGAELLGFQAGVDMGDEYEAKGKRAGRDRPAQQDNRQQRKGGRRGKIIVDDNEFPTL